MVLATMNKRKRTQVDSYREIGNDEESEGEGNDYKNGDGDHTQDNKKAKKRQTLEPTPRVRETKKTIFPFLDLPPKLRIQIYSRLLVNPYELELVSITKHHRRYVTRGNIRRKLYHHRKPYQLNGLTNLMHRDTSLTLQSALLAVNRQINIEATALLYKQPIHILDTAVLHDFLTGIGAANKALLRNISIHNWTCNRATNSADLTALAGCTALEHVVFECKIGPYRADGRGVARQLYKNSSYWLEAMVSGKGVDAALDVIRLSDMDFGIVWLFDASGMKVRAEGPGAVREGRVVFDQEMRALLAQRPYKRRAWSCVLT